jgi:threonyl-tRNA synthetase
VQAIVLSVNDASVPWAESFIASLREAGIRTDHDFSNDSLGNKIRLARNRRIPYIVIIGDKERENSTVSFKTYFDGNAGGVRAEEVVQALVEAVRGRLPGLPNITGGKEPPDGK